MKHKVRKRNGDQEAELVDGDHNAGRAVLQGFIIAKPGAAGGKARQADEGQLAPWNFPDGVLFPAANTIIQAMSSTTPVRMAVPRLDSTPEIPIFPRMDVRLANRAEPMA